MWHSSEGRVRLPTNLLRRTLSCIEMYGFNGSDVTNVIFYSLFLSVILPSQCVCELVGFPCHEINKDLWPVPSENTSMWLASFFPVDGNLCYGSSVLDSLVLASYVKHTPDVSKPFWEKPALLDLGWLLVHKRLYSFVDLLAVFLSLLFVNISFLAQVWLGKYFIPFVQLSKR